MAVCLKCRGEMGTLAAVCPHCGYDYAPPPPRRRPRLGRPARVALRASAALFVAACALPAGWLAHYGPVPFLSPSFDLGPAGRRGIRLLLEGPFGVAGFAAGDRDLAFCLGWPANPLLVVGGLLLRSRRPRAAAGCGLAAALLAGWCVAASWPDRVGHPQYPLAGAYCWAASVLVFAVGAAAAAVTGWLPQTLNQPQRLAPGA